MRGRIICITPIKHLEGVYERLEQYENFFYEPNITKDELSKRVFVCLMCPKTFTVF